MGTRREDEAGESSEAVIIVGLSNSPFSYQRLWCSHLGSSSFRVGLLSEKNVESTTASTDSRKSGVELTFLSFLSFTKQTMRSSPPRRPRPQIEVSPLTRDDFEDLARAQLKAMENDNVYDRIYPASKRPKEEVRIGSFPLLPPHSPFLLFASLFLPSCSHRTDLLASPLLSSQPSCSLPAHAIQTRTSRPFPFSPSDSFELKATLPGSSKLIGFAYWVGPTDRTATLGGPTPEEELEAEEEGKKEKSEQQKEKEKTMDLEFHKAFVGEAKRARREIMQGREHWYLVSVLEVRGGRKGRGKKRKGGLGERSPREDSRRLFLPPSNQIFRSQGLLFVDPAYQGMGVGSALLNFGISRADAAGLPMYLESSNPVRPSRCSPLSKAASVD